MEANVPDTHDTLRDMRQIAFDLAAQGFKVFPLQPKSKLPHKGVSWRALVCADEVAAWNLWSEPTYRESNIGIHCEGLIVVDVDDYKAAADAGALAALDLPPTFTVATARGGRHLYFKGPDVANSASKLAPGIDVRGVNGYVVGPGSVTDDGTYQEVQSLPVAAAPQALVDRCKSARESAKRDTVDWQAETPAARLDDGRQYLASARVSVEGCGGNNTAFQVIGELWDKGVAATAALDLLTEPGGWNERCLPPWSEEELRQIIHNAYTYAQNDFACRAADTVFGPVVIPETPEPENFLLPMCVSAADLLSKPVPPFEWLVPGLIPAHDVTLLYGDGGIGKSWLALQLAAAVATGKPWLGLDVRRQGGALYVSAEDGHDDLHRRLSAVAAAHDMAATDLAGLRLLDITLAPTTAFATFDRDNVMKETPVWVNLRKLVGRTGTALVVVDTLADVFAGDEISKSHAREFVHLLQRFAKEQRTAVVVLAHPSLAGMESGRGTSGNTAWSNSVRSRLYLERDAKLKDGKLKDVRKLSVMKANHAATGASLSVRWVDGKGFMRLDEAEAVARHDEAEAVFLACLRSATARGNVVTNTGGHNFAPKEFRNYPEAQGYSQDDLRSAMERLEAKGTIRKVGFQDT
ncbi:MAG: AAA family ATPase, partial [Rhodobacter sp.]|nr:AAA family ATPase [Rhodobacter sp.]